MERTAPNADVHQTGICGYSPNECGSSTCISNCDAKAECGQYGVPGNNTCPINVCCSQFGFCGTTDVSCLNINKFSLLTVPDRTFVSTDAKPVTAAAALPKSLLVVESVLAEPLDTMKGDLQSVVVTAVFLRTSI